MKRQNSDLKVQTVIFCLKILQILKFSSQQEADWHLAIVWQKKIKADPRNDFSFQFPMQKIFFMEKKSKTSTFLKHILVFLEKRLRDLNMEESTLIILISQQKQSFISAEYHLWSRNSSQT